MLGAPHAAHRPGDFFGLVIHDGDHIQFPHRDQEIAGGEDGRTMNRLAVQDFQGVGVEDVAGIRHVVQEGAVYGFFEGLQQIDRAQHLALGRKMGDVVHEHGFAGADLGHEFRFAGQNIDASVRHDFQIMMTGTGIAPDQARFLVDEGQSVAFENGQHPAVGIQIGAAPATGDTLGVRQKIGRGAAAGADAIFVGQPPGVQDFPLRIHQIGPGFVAGGEKTQPSRCHFQVVGGYS